MRHNKKGRKLGRTRSQRKALLANLASSLIINEYMTTTEAKAKECKAFVDRVLNTAVSNDTEFASRRVRQLIRDPLATKKVMEVLTIRFKDQRFGYVTMSKVGNRHGDNADMVKMVLVGSEPFRKVKKVSVRKKVQKKEESAKEGIEKPGVLDTMKKLGGRIRGGEKGKSQQTTKTVVTKSRSGL